MLKRYKLNSLKLFIAVAVAGLSGCSSINDFMDTKNAVNYQNNESVKKMDFPPDLTAPEFDMAFALPANGVVSASSISRSGAYTVDGRGIRVLPKSATVRIGSQGAVRWLDVSTSAESLWPKMRDFWRSVGVSLKRDEPRIGLMETDWAVNRSGLPLNWFNKAMGSVLGGGYDASSRDRYRIRVEKSSARATRVFLTHKGAEKVVIDSGSGWELRPANHELEVEMLNRLRAFLLGDTNAAKSSLATTDATQTSSIVNMIKQEGHYALQVHDNYKHAWVLTGIMMDRMGLVIEKRNQSAGIYEAEYEGNDEDSGKRGFLGRVFGGRKTILLKDENYQVHVQDAGKLSIIRIFSEEGKPLSSRQEKLVLARLKKEFDR